MKIKILTILVFVLSAVILGLSALLILWMTGYLGKEFNLRQTNGLPGTVKGIVIHYQYEPSRFFPEEWLQDPIHCDGAQVDLSEAQRVIPLIEDFASAYDPRTLDINLTDIYLLSELRCYGKTYGGTNSLSALYIKVGSRERGFTDPFLLALLHMEFSSILMRNYTFPAEEWAAINEQDFVYAENAVEIVEQEGLEDPAPEYLEQGFLNRYATTSLENDFNEFVSWLFVQPEELCRLRIEYEKIEQKSDLAMQFYASVDPTIEWPVCR
jgi:hypothetical protein